MLAITVKKGQAFNVGVAVVHIVGINGQQVRIGIEAPAWIKVWRTGKDTV